jgi:DNA-binding LacI/PurR family transcriptional regulator
MSSVEVARLAGVSQATVSRVFTPGASASEEMRAKVMTAAKMLGYRPNAIARSLTKRSTHMIGLAMAGFMNPFCNRLLQAASAKLQARGYWTLLLNASDRNGLEDTLPAALQFQVDGLIITSAVLSSRLIDECAWLGTPVVLLNGCPLVSDVNAICCDDVRGGRLVADALISAGHQHIAYIAGGSGSDASQDRELGFVLRLRERGYELTAREKGDDSYESAYLAAKRLFDREQRPDAIFCANDLMAMAALDVAWWELGLRVPEDLSVIGFDDILQAGWPGYDLITVRQHLERIVDAIIELLLSAIKNPDHERVMRVFTPTLVVRGSARLEPHPLLAIPHPVALARNRMDWVRGQP